MTRGWLVGALCVLPGVLAAWAYFAGGGSPPVSTLRALASEATHTRATVRVADLRGQRAGDFLTVTGTATNVSRQALQDVEAVVEWFGADGKLKAVESALLEFSPVGPGSESPFRVVARDGEPVTAFRVRFRTLTGVPIPSADGK